MNHNFECIDASTFQELLRTAIEVPEYVKEVKGDVIVTNADIVCAEVKNIRFLGEVSLTGCRFKNGFKFLENDFDSQAKDSNGLNLSGSEFFGELEISQCQRSLGCLKNLDISTKDSTSPAGFKSDHFKGVDLTAVIIHGRLSIKGEKHTNYSNWCLILDSACIDGELKVVLPYGGNGCYLFASNTKVAQELRITGRCRDWLWLRNGDFGRDCYVSIECRTTSLGSQVGRVCLTDSKVGGSVKISCSSLIPDASLSLGLIDCRSTQIGGDLIIRPGIGKEEYGARRKRPSRFLTVSFIDGRGVKTGGEILVEKVLLNSAKGFLSGIDFSESYCRKSITIRRVRSRKPYEGQPSQESMINLRDCTAKIQILVSDIRARSSQGKSTWSLAADLYGTSAKLIDIEQVCARQSGIDLGASKVAEIISVNKTRASHLSVRYAQAKAVRIQGSSVGMPAARAARADVTDALDCSFLKVDGYLKIKRCELGSAVLYEARIGSLVSFEKVNSTSVNCRLIRTDGQLSLNGCSIKEFDLSQAVIGAELQCLNLKSRVFRGDALVVKSTVNFSCCRISDRISLEKAAVSSSINFHHVFSKNINCRSFSSSWFFRIEQCRFDAISLRGSEVRSDVILSDVKRVESVSFPVKHTKRK